jgi:choice-of-anchor B domain-containing protein
LISAHDHKEGLGEGGNGQPGNQPLSAMSFTPCTNGMAGTFPCRNVDLASFLPLADIGGGTANDIWGWTDPLTGKEYAIMGRSNGTSFVDISDPQHPVYLGNLPPHGADSIWRGIKVYANHAFIISEAVGHGMQVFDLRQLRNVAAPPTTFTETAHYGNFGRAHTLAINETTGFAYACGSRDTCSAGLHMINVQNPAAPTFAGCVAGDGYVHEAQCVTYHGPDRAYLGREICFNSNEDTLTIVDVTDKSAPVQLSRTGYPGAAYTHQGWLTDDHARFLLDDELDEKNFGGNSKTYIWDLADLDAPVYTSLYIGPTPAIDHNLYIRGQYAFESNYRSGLRILNLGGIASSSLNEVAFFDVYPVNDDPAFNGTWNNYPYFASGNVIVSGIEQGLFVLRPNFALRTLIDDSTVFVRQHYLDFLSREPDVGGLAYWNNQLAACGTDAACIHRERINVSAAFFIENEFQQTGSFVYRLYAAGLGRRPLYTEFSTDRQQVIASPNLEQNKNAFASAFVQRQEFVQKYSTATTAESFVDALLSTVWNGTASDLGAERTLLIELYKSGSSMQESRTSVLRYVIEDRQLKEAVYNPSFVLMQYFGYLKRDPDEGGYLFWLDVLNNREPGNYRGMVCSFLTSVEYQNRFGTLATRSNRDCSP